MRDCDCCFVIFVIAVLLGLAHFLDAISQSRLDEIRVMNRVIADNAERCEWEDVCPVVTKVPDSPGISHRMTVLIYNETGVIQMAEVSSSARCLTIGPASMCPLLSGDP